MSEPVGNAPRTPGDIPGNSHKNREKPPEKPTTEVSEEREPAQKIIEGKVVVRKTPWYKKFARSMVADDAQSMGDFVLTELIVPGVKNLLWDALTGSLERGLYGNARVGRRGPREGRGSLRTRYDRMYEDDREPRRMMSREARARHDFGDVILDSRAEAVDTIESLIDRIARYGSASVADMYDFVGVTGSYADRNYGWTDLRDADVRQVRGGYLLDLPRPELLR